MQRTRAITRKRLKGMLGKFTQLRKLGAIDLDKEIVMDKDIIKSKPS